MRLPLRAWARNASRAGWAAAHALPHPCVPPRFPSYAHLHLSREILGVPERVNAFLHALGRALRPRAERESETLGRAKQLAEGGGETRAWDVPYYMGQLRAREFVDPSVVAEYFALDRVLEGLQVLWFTQAYLCAHTACTCNAHAMHRVGGVEESSHAPNGGAALSMGRSRVHHRHQCRSEVLCVRGGQIVWARCGD